MTEQANNVRSDVVVDDKRVPLDRDSARRVAELSARIAVRGSAELVESSEIAVRSIRDHGE